MSVPKSKRSPCILQAALKARELCVHTLHLTKGKKFIPEYQEALTNHINALAISIYINVRTANDIVVKNEDDLKDRVSLQKKAAASCNNLMYLISVAHHLFHLRSRSVVNWCNMAIETRDIIKSWSDSDKKRYKGI